VNPEQLSAAVTVLTSMITPAVLISACGTLILSTSNRLSRVNDRVRHLADELEKLAAPQSGVRMLEARRDASFQQLRLLMRRARLLQRALNMLYIGVCTFVASSIAIGLHGLIHVGLAWLPVAFGLCGAGLLFVVGTLLIVETSVARRTLGIELKFLSQLGGELSALTNEEIGLNE